MFALASLMGARAGELMALTVGDLDFERKAIRVNKSADDRTRVVRLVGAVGIETTST